MKIKFLLILSFLIFTFNVSAQLTLPSIFADNMVLQRDMQIPVWGKSTPFAKVIIKFNGQEKMTSADDAGDWKTFLSPASADSNPQLVPTAKPVAEKMSIESDNSKITFTNILVGEVWLCSGQSNMQSPLKNADEGEKYISKSQDGRFRFFQTKRFVFKPYECDNCVGSWKIAASESVKNLTAVGYFFGLELIKKLNVPVGLIQIDFGGTRIETWMNANDLGKWDVYKDELNKLAKYKNSKRFTLLKNKEKKIGLIN